MKLTDIRSVEELILAISEGASPKYLFFWGHTPRIPETLDQSCLSNWYPAEFLVDEVRYPTTEHFMMAEKARLFEDGEMRERILMCGTPGEAKKLGRMVRNFDEAVWNEHRFEIVVTGAEAKFRQNHEMGALLGRTGEKVIVEASPRSDLGNWNGRLQ